MHYNTCALSTALVVSLGVTSFAAAQHHEDIILGVIDNKIVTGIVDGSGQPQYPHYVWAENFGSAGFPNFAVDPGFDSPSGTFTPGTVVGISIRKALRAWNEDDEHFLDVPEDQTISISRFSSTITTPTSDPGCAAFPSLALGAANSSGIIHVHPDYFLDPPHEPGVYLLELQVWANAEGLFDSDPFWIVFNQNQPQSIVADALAWVEDNLVSTSCPADLNGDGVIDVSDLLLLLAAWGDDPGQGADLNGDCVVDVSDLLMLLSAWGDCL